MDPAPIHVLLVDDDSSLLEVAGQLLERHGYATTLCTSAAAALTTLRDAAALPDVVLFDLHLPHMNGWEFRLALLAEPRWSELPVIVISGDESAMARAIHARSHIPKPLDATRLLAAVAAATSADSQDARRREQLEQLQQRMRESAELWVGAADRIAIDLVRLRERLDIASRQSAALERRVARAEQFTMIGLRQLIEHVKVGSHVMHRLANAAKAAAEEVLRHASGIDNPDPRQLH